LTIKALSEGFALTQSASLPRRCQTDKDGSSQLGPDESLSCGRPVKLLEVERLESQEAADFLLPAPQFPGIPACRPPSFPASKLPGFPASQLPGLPASRFPDLPAIS